MRHEPRILPCVTLAVVVLAVGRSERVEGRAEAAFRIEPAHEAGFGIEEVAVGFAAIEEIVVIGRIAALRRDLSHGPVGQRVLHVVGHRFVEEVAGDIAVFHAQVHTPLAEHGGLLQRLVGQLLVEAVVTFQHDVGHGRDAGIADHAVGLVAREVPDGKLALLRVDMEHRMGDVGHLLRMENRHQRLGSAVGVPQREGRIVHERRGAVDLAVSAPIVAVHVAELRRSDHRVVERRIEDAAGGFVRSLDTHLLQLGVPRLVGRRRRSFEVPAGKFRLHVELGVLDAHGRNRHFHIERLAVGRIELHAGVTALDRNVALLRNRLRRIGIGDILHRLREFGREVNALILGPARRIAVTAEPESVGNECGLGGLVPAAAVFEVKDHGGLLRRGEGVFVQPDTLGGGQLHIDAVAVEPRGVIARTGFFVLTAEIGPKPRLRVVLRAAGVGHPAHDRHHRDVEQVADTRTVEVGMAETDDGRIGNVVSRHPVPRLRDAGGAELHGAERNVGPHEDMAVAARADIHVDILRQRLLLRLRTGGRNQQNG